MSGINHLLSDARGQYLPQNFIECYSASKWGVTDEDAETLLAGPGQEWYWETWDDVLSYATFTDESGNVWRLYQDGDLFALCDELMTLEEKMNFGFDVQDELNEVLDANPEFEVKHDGSKFYWTGPDGESPTRSFTWELVAKDCIEQNMLTK